MSEAKIKESLRLLHAPIGMDFVFLSDSRDVEETRDHVIIPDNLEIRSLFIKGSEVWGMEGTIPYLWSFVYPLEFKPEYESEYVAQEIQHAM